MQEPTMNMKKKLGNARVLCPGMSDYMYMLTDYIAKNTLGKRTPSEAAMRCQYIRRDLVYGRNSFGGKFPKRIRRNRQALLDEFRQIPAVIDAVADADFASQFHIEWEKCRLDVVPLKKIDPGDELPAYIKVAVDWWENAITMAPELNVTMGSSAPLATGFAERRLSTNGMAPFRKALADMIERGLERTGVYCLDVDRRGPCLDLEVAGESIGIFGTSKFPWKWGTHMEISEKCVTVCIGHRAPCETLWKE